MGEPLTSKQTAEALGIDEGTLRKWRVQGRGPQYYKFGRRVVYDAEEFETWKLEHRYFSTSDEGGQR